MKSLYFAIAVTSILLGCSDDHKEPQPLIDKEFQFRIYSVNDYSDESYDDQFVKIRLAAMIMTYEPYKEEDIFSDSTDWIALKDLPSSDQAILFEGLAEKINESKQTVVVGYSIEHKIGEQTTFLSKNDFIDRRETQLTIPIVF